MNWTDKKSIKLSMICLYIFAWIVVLTMLFISRVVASIVPVYILSPENQYYFYLTLELCMGVGLVILFFLRRLIKNIDNDVTFDEENISILRIISWLCFLEAAILLVSTIYYYPWLFVAGLASFIGLIIRVIKNVFCQALLIKTENDFTI